MARISNARKRAGKGGGNPILLKKNLVKQKDKQNPENENNNTVFVLAVNQIKDRLNFQEYELKRGLQQAFGLSDTEFETAIDQFLVCAKDLNKDFSEVKNHFSNWVKLNLKTIRAKPTEQTNGKTIASRLSILESAKQKIRNNG